MDLVHQTKKTRLTIRHEDYCHLENIVSELTPCDSYLFLGMSGTYVKKSEFDFGQSGRG